MSEHADRVAVEVVDGLGHLRMVRAQARNAIDVEMALALADGARRLERADGLRAVLISADGPSFTVGGDLPHIAEQSHRLDEHLGEMLTPYHDALGRLAVLPAPVVCAVQGAVAGGGLGLVWCADLVLAAEDATFQAGFGQLGLSNDGGTSWWLPRLVGLRRAQEFLLTGRALDAEEALDWGMVTRVVPPDRLAEESHGLALSLARGPTVALANQRRLLREGALHSLPETLDDERRTIMVSARTADAAEGISSFAEQRQPRFEGN